MLRIGEFSRITGLTIKALHHYQKEGLLVPDYIDEENGYRYYRPVQIDRALTIALLRDLDLPVDVIRTALREVSEDETTFEQRVRTALLEYRKVLRDRMGNDRITDRRISSLLAERSHRFDDIDKQERMEVADAVLDDCEIVSVRFRGAYNEVGSHFKRLFRVAGADQAGPPFCLYHEMEYSELADIEACLPVKNKVNRGGLVSRKLSGGKTVSILHRGPYTTIGASYAKLFEIAQGRPPIREIYEKGPGLFFRGNPKNYCTRIHVFVDDGTATNGG